MISITELKDLIARKKTLIDSFEPSKKQYVYDLEATLEKLIKRYNKLEKEIDDDKNPPSDLSGALTNLRELEKQINPKESELKNILDEKEPIRVTRDPSDAGTVGGNGAVVFRTNGGKEPEKAKGTLTQDDIVRLIKEGKIKVPVKTKP